MKRFPIVILPGWLLGSDRYLPLKQELTRAGFNAEIVDFPGFEQGTALFRAWNLTDYVNFLRNYLKTHHLNKPVFICHSFGGRVALKLLSEEPTVAQALILSGTPGYRSLYSNRRLLVTTISQIGRKLIKVPPFSLLGDFPTRIFYVVVGARDLSKLSGFIRQTFINIVEEDLEVYMKKIRVPTLLLWGVDDPLVGLEIAEKMHATIPRSKLVTLPATRHNVPYRQPELFVAQVKAFLDSL
jgi:pimeloyl-ACP methyl ester carboxylesterase